MRRATRITSASRPRRASSAARLADDLPDGALAEIASQTARLRKQLDAIVAIDFFGADGREPAEGLVSGLEARLQRRMAT